MHVRRQSPESPLEVLTVAWPFLAGMLLMLMISIGSIYALSAMRAYVTGLAIWVSAEGDANAAMRQYLTHPEEVDLVHLRQSISIWEGDHAARLELLKSDPDYAIARRELLAGGNHPKDIEGLIWLFRGMLLLPAWQEPVRVWAAADRQYENYLPFRQRMLAGLAVDSPAPEELGAWRPQLDRVHEAIVSLEHAFAQAIDADARRLTASLLAFLCISSVLLLAGGYLAVRRILRRTDTMAAALRTIERRAFEEHERASVLLRSIEDGVIATDRRGLVQFLNGGAEHLTGWSIAEAYGRPIDEVFRLHHAGDSGNKSTELIRRDGSCTPIGERTAPLRDRDGQIVGMVLVMRDVTPERRLSDQLRHEAMHDALTGLANRVQFEQRLAATLRRSQSARHTYAAAFIDLDQFKVVNDTGGHAAGDELIRRVGASLRAQLREGDLLARLDGDEFGLVLPNCSLDIAVQIAERMRRSVETLRYVSDGCTFTVNASIGVVHSDQALQSVEDVLRAADRACYAAKEAGRNRVHVYRADDPEIDSRRGEMRWISRLQEALEQNRFVLYTQEIRPIGAAAGSPPLCHEVLLRLKDESGQLVPPMAFIPAAERFGLMPQIDRWVIEHTLAEQSRRIRLGLPAPRCMINLSGASLDNPELADFIEQRLRQHRLPPGSIGFELTETAAISRLTTAVKVMNRLKELGCPVALDDFGAGMSSYGYLRELPVTILKIDGRFVRDMNHDPVAYAMVESMHKVARAMGIRTVAEWVENNATLAALRRMGVDHVQGRGIAAEQAWSDAYRRMERENADAGRMALACL